MPTHINGRICTHIHGWHLRTNNARTFKEHFLGNAVCSMARHSVRSVCINAFGIYNTQSRVRCSVCIYEMVVCFVGVYSEKILICHPLVLLRLSCGTSIHKSSYLRYRICFCATYIWRNKALLSYILCVCHTKFMWATQLMMPPLHYLEFTPYTQCTNLIPVYHALLFSWILAAKQTFLYPPFMVECVKTKAVRNYGGLVVFTKPLRVAD